MPASRIPPVVNPLSHMRTNATACSLCPHRGDRTKAGARCGVDGLPMTQHAVRGSCPRNRHTSVSFEGRELVIVTRWMGLRWYGLAWPLRLWAMLVLPHHPRPGRAPVVSVTLARCVLALRRVGLLPRRYRWLVRVGSSVPRLPGCGCSVVGKRWAARAAGVWSKATADAWPIGGADRVAESRDAETQRPEQQGAAA